MTTDADDPLAPAVAGADADDAAWLLARSRGDAAAPPRAGAARAYDQLEAMLGDLDPIAPPPDWQARVLAGADAIDAEEAAALDGAGAAALANDRAVVPAAGASVVPAAGASAVPATGASEVPAAGASVVPAVGASVVPLRAPAVSAGAPARRAPDRRRTIAVAGAALAAAAVLVLLLRPKAPGSAPVVAVQFSRDGTPRGGADAALGDELTAIGRLVGAGALRLYREDASLVAECPRDGAPVCMQHPEGQRVVHQLSWTLVAPGRYRVVLFAGPVPASAGTYDADFRAARQAGVKLEHPTHQTFHVR